jgi:hypothetical protein
MNGPLLQQPWLFLVDSALGAHPSRISWSLAWPPTQQGSAKAPAGLDQDHLTGSQAARIAKPILRQFAAPRALKNMLAQVKGSVPFATLSFCTGARRRFWLLALAFFPPNFSNADGWLYSPPGFTGKLS